MLFETALPLPVFSLRREMNRLFDDLLTRTVPTNSWLPNSWLPPVDVREDQRELVINVELPGIDITRDSIG